MKVTFFATHIHTGPGYTRMTRTAKKGGGFRALLESELPADRKYVESAPISSNDECIFDQEMLELLVERLTKVVLEAWQNRGSGSYTNAFGRAVVGMCRRATYNDGSAQMWGDTNTAVFEALEGGNDSGIDCCTYLTRIKS